MTSFEDLSKNFIWIAMFALALFLFFGGMAVNYDRDTSDVLHESLPQQAIEDYLEDQKTRTFEYKNSTIDRTQDRGKLAGTLDLGLFVLEGVFGITKLMANAILSGFGIIAGIFVSILRVDSIFITGLAAILLITVVLKIWRVIKAGQ